MTGGYKKVKNEEYESNKSAPEFKFVLANVENFTRVTQSLKVIARASPDDKFLLVIGLK